MQAIILAAGMGTRLKEITQKKPKCMVIVKNRTIVERQLKQLDILNLSRIIVVDGYLKDVLEPYIKSLNIKTPIIFIENEIYNSTNNIYSLYLSKNYLKKEDAILLESDLIFNNNILPNLSKQPDTTAVISKYDSWMDGTTVKINNNEKITRFIPKQYIDSENKNELFKTVNIYKINKDYSNNYLIPFLEFFLKIFGANEYYEQVFRLISEIKTDSMATIKIDPKDWYEIDNKDDLKNAEKLKFLS